MNINLLTMKDKILDINEDIVVEEELLKTTSVKKLLNTKFIGKLTRIYDTSYELSGNIKGTMILIDDVTLEDVNYDFDIEILENIDEFDENNENNLQIVNNTLDIFDFLWQNILVEIPLKVVGEKNTNLKLEGKGWRLISEEDLEKNNPLSELENIIQGKE